MSKLGLNVNLHNKKNYVSFILRFSEFFSFFVAHFATTKYGLKVSYIFCLTNSVSLFNYHRYFFQGVFGIHFRYFIRHCFICRPSESTCRRMLGFEPRTVAILALAVRRSIPLGYKSYLYTHFFSNCQFLLIHQIFSSFLYI